MAKGSSLAFWRSSAQVYWVRSLVPMEKKSHSSARSSATSTAAGVSIMVPTSMSPIFLPSAASSTLHSSRMFLASWSSRRLVIMGNMMPRLP